VREGREIAIGSRARKYKSRPVVKISHAVANPVVIAQMSDDNNDWEIWDAPTCTDPSAMFLVIAAVVWAVLRIWPISIPALAFVSFFI
jgi:hypothetical protein